MNKVFAAMVVAAAAIFAPLPVAHSSANGVIPEARANGVINEAKAVDAKPAGVVGDFRNFNSGLPMDGGFDRQREVSSWLDPKGPTGSISWIAAFGFLLLIILRRTRSSPMS